MISTRFPPPCPVERRHVSVSHQVEGLPLRVRLDLQMVRQALIQLTQQMVDLAERQRACSELCGYVSGPRSVGPRLKPKSRVKLDNPRVLYCIDPANARFPVVVVGEIVVHDLPERHITPPDQRLSLCWPSPQQSFLDRADLW